MLDAIKTKRTFIFLTFIPVLILASMGFLRLEIADIATAAYPLESFIYENGEYNLHQVLFISSIVLGISMSYVMLKFIRSRFRMVVYAGLLLVLAFLLFYCLFDKKSFVGVNVHFYVPYLAILAALFLGEIFPKIFSWPNFWISAALLLPIFLAFPYLAIRLTYLLTFTIFWTAVALKENRQNRKGIMLATAGLFLIGVAAILLLKLPYPKISDWFEINVKGGWGSIESLREVFNESCFFGASDLKFEIQLFDANAPDPMYMYPDPDPSLIRSVPAWAALATCDGTCSILSILLALGWIPFLLAILAAASLITGLAREAVKGPNKQYTAFIYVAVAYFSARSVLAILGCCLSLSVPSCLPFCGDALTTLADSIIYTYAMFTVLHGETMKRENFPVKKDKLGRQNNFSINTFNGSLTGCFISRSNN